jgi:AraC-like DNA-binding protein
LYKPVVPPIATRAILNPLAGARAFALERRPPTADLAQLVARYWLVRWDLRGQPPFAQETLPYPCVHLVFGTHQPGLHGVLRRRFVANLRGEGCVIGVKFRPGRFRALLGRDVSTITDRALPVGEVFGPAGDRLNAAVRGAADDGARIAAIEAFLRARGAEAPAEADIAGGAVDLVEGDPSLSRVDALARRVGVAPRRLERLFRAHVGVSPKWVIRTFRVQEAAERVKAGAPADWAGLAQELGYFDQPHFIRDFRAVVGETPSAYAARCAAAAP